MYVYVYVDIYKIVLRKCFKKMLLCLKRCLVAIIKIYINFNLISALFNVDEQSDTLMINVKR